MGRLLRDGRDVTVTLEVPVTLRVTVLVGVAVRVMVLVMLPFDVDDEVRVTVEVRVMVGDEDDVRLPVEEGREVTLMDLLPVDERVTLDDTVAVRVLLPVTVAIVLTEGLRLADEDRVALPVPVPVKELILLTDGLLLRDIVADGRLDNIADDEAVIDLLGKDDLVGFTETVFVGVLWDDLDDVGVEAADLLTVEDKVGRGVNDELAVGYELNVAVEVLLLLVVGRFVYVPALDGLVLVEGKDVIVLVLVGNAERLTLTDELPVFVGNDDRDDVNVGYDDTVVILLRVGKADTREDTVACEDNVLDKEGIEVREGLLVYVG